MVQNPMNKVGYLHALIIDLTKRNQKRVLINCDSNWGVNPILFIV